MSTNSILKYNQESLQQYYGDKLDYLAKQYFYKKKFLLGNGADKNEVRATTILNRVFNTTQCELIDYIVDSITLELESCGIKTKDRKLTTLEKCCKEETNNCNFNECNPRIEF